MIDIFFWPVKKNILWPQFACRISPENQMCLCVIFIQKKKTKNDSIMLSSGRHQSQRRYIYEHFTHFYDELAWIRKRKNKLAR